MESRRGSRINVEKNLNRQRVQKREKDDEEEKPAHLHWKEGYDRVLPEVSFRFDRFSISGVTTIAGTSVQLPAR